MRITQHRFWLAFQIGCTYIGTVVGAGFASGQEIFQFFGRYGNLGYVAILIASSLFAVLGYRVMLLGHKLRAHSYRELNAFLFGERLGGMFDMVLIVMLFGVSVAMLAGAGALFHERLTISFQVGAVATVIITFFTLIKGMNGILRANTIIVPTMVSFVLYATLHAIHDHGWGSSFASGQMLTASHPPVVLISGLIYAAFNLGLAAGVLIPLGAEVEDTGVLRLGASIGAIGLGVMLVALMFTLLTYYPTVMRFAVPMGHVAEQLGSVLQWAFVFVLWGEIYSTLVGNVFAVGAQFAPRNKRQFAVTCAAILALAYLFSQVGFSAMVKYVYGVFGWISTLILIALLWPRQKLP